MANLPLTNRHPHIVRKVHGSRLPSQTVAIALRDGTPGHGPTVAIASARIKDGRAVRQEIESGSRQWALDYLFRLARRGTCVWLVARGLHETLVKLGWFDALDKGDWTICRQGREQTGQIVHEPHCTYAIATRRDGGRLVAVDAGNYGVSSLPGWSEYQTANAECLMCWWLDWLCWLKEMNAGSLRLTLASQAMYCYRKRFMHHDIFCHANDKALSLEQAALFGGRCEAYRIGKLPGPVYHLDANSLYGAVAYTAKVPAVLVAYDEGPLLDAIGGSYDMVADVTLAINEPCVPFRDKEAALTVWPTGSFRTALCGPELSLVWDQITQIHQWAIYRTAPLFSDWASWCYERRVWEQQTGKPVLAGQLKMWSQLFYGKWAQRYRGWRHDPQGVCLEPWDLWWEMNGERDQAVPHRAVAGRAEVFEDQGLAPGAVPIITAWINSLARVWLWKAIQVAGPREVYYVDTDSLMVSRRGLKRLTDANLGLGHGLGMLRLVAKHNQVIIHGWKHYEADGELTCAGIPLSRRSGVIDAVAGEEAEPVTIGCHSHRPPQPAAAVMAWVRTGEYRHGVVLKSGLVRPHHFGG